MNAKQIAPLTPQPEFRDYIAEGTRVTWTKAPDTRYYPELSAEEKESATPKRDGEFDRGDPEGIQVRRYPRRLVPVGWEPKA